MGEIVADIKKIKKLSPFKNQFQEFIFVRTYSRWVEEKGRRETWNETVGRYRQFIEDSVGGKLKTEHFDEMEEAIFNFDVMPSMRALWAAGEAAKQDHFAIYNCSFTTIEKIKDFAEVLYILMHGTGVGFSVERKFVNELPKIQPMKEGVQPARIVVEDSKMGWAKAFLSFLQYAWEGYKVEVDYSFIRPKGSRLKTFGGRASGPEPLKKLFEFCEFVLNENREEGRLRAIDVHDIVCKIAEIVVVGGVRRSALISLSDLTNHQMATAKTGEFWINNSQRGLANNSVAYTRKPDILSFLEEWKKLIESNSGERGIFNRVASVNKANENGRRDGSLITGTNPCGEILLRNKQLCNLSEVVVRPGDALDDLKKKVRIAAMIGTIQSTFTHFKFVDKQWTENCEAERLLGVSLTGVRDHLILGRVNDEAKRWLSELKHVAINANKEFAALLGIPASAAVTCVKPSGTVSSLVDSAPGCHKRQTDGTKYIRRVRVSATDPLAQLLKNEGVPYHPEVGQNIENCNTFVFEFPMTAPEGSSSRKNQTAIEQLEFWKMYRDYWCEHNPSITISVRESEWIETAAWVYKNFDNVGGLSFLPHSDFVYELAPYESVDEETYNKLMSQFPKDIDFSKLSFYEKEDHTEGAKEYACVGDKCDVI